MRAGEWQKKFHPADFWKQDYFFLALLFIDEFLPFLITTIIHTSEILKFV